LILKILQKPILKNKQKYKIVIQIELLQIEILNAQQNTTIT